MILARRLYMAEPALMSARAPTGGAPFAAEVQ